MKFKTRVTVGNSTAEVGDNTQQPVYFPLLVPKYLMLGPSHQRKLLCWEDKFPERRADTSYKC